MELMVRDGDYLPDGEGGFRRAEGADELLQRVLWKLSIPRGSFPLLPGLGSGLYRLGRARPSERQALARQYVAEALAGGHRRGAVRRRHPAGVSGVARPDPGRDRGDGRDVMG